MEIIDYHLFKKLQAKYAVDPTRIEMGKATFSKDVIAWQEVSNAWLVGRVWVRISKLEGTATCNCQDFRRGVEKSQPVLCRHLIALLLRMMVDEGLDPGVAGVSSEVTEVVEAAPLSFGERIDARVGQAVHQLSMLIGVVIDEGDIPLLFGPSGSGKTAAARELADLRNWGFEEVAGADSFADSDLVGLDLGTRKNPGVLARAFARARAGETTLILLDEIPRFNVRALDILMTPLLPIPRSTAIRQGIPATGDIYKVEAPIWGIEWAPVEHIKFVAAANPWGNTLDPALISRFAPMTVKMEDSIAGMFDSSYAEAIRISWRNVESGVYPLGIEYRALRRAKSAADISIFRNYLTRLHYIDRSAAESFDMILKGMGIVAR
jgi:hypothetical protein